MLKRHSDLSLGDWVTKGLPRPQSVRSPEWQGNSVSHCLPAGFPAYCKLFHPIYVDEQVEDRSLSWAVADDDAACLPGKLVSVGTPADPTGPRVRWEEIAEKHGLVFHPELTCYSLRQAFQDGSMPRHLLGPDEGSLDRPTSASLVEVLKSYQPSERCFFYYDMIATHQIEPLLFEGDVQDVLDSFALDNVYGTPTYWWPESRSWCVCTDWDLTFTLIGGPEDLIRVVLKSDELEALIVSEDTRIDYKSDRINRGGAG